MVSSVILITIICREWWCAHRILAHTVKHVAEAVAESLQQKQQSATGTGVRWIKKKAKRMKKVCCWQAVVRYREPGCTVLPIGLCRHEGGAQCDGVSFTEERAEIASEYSWHVLAAR